MGIVFYTIFLFISNGFLLFYQQLLNYKVVEELLHSYIINFFLPVFLDWLLIWFTFFLTCFKEKEKKKHIHILFSYHSLSSLSLFHSQTNFFKEWLNICQQYSRKLQRTIIPLKEGQGRGLWHSELKTHHIIHFLYWTLLFLPQEKLMYQ